MARHLEQRIEVGGSGAANLAVKTAVNASMRNLLSSTRADWPGFGLSPGGLCNNEYSGHTFWDQEQWKWPSITPLWPAVAEAVIAYRFKRLGAAFDHAQRSGFPGAMFPLESAVTGEKVCPAHYLRHVEQHAIGDVAFAVT